MNDSTKQQVKDVYDKVHEANQELYYIWKDGILFSWQWWLGLGLVVAAWTIWFIYRKKSSASRLLFAGFAVIILCCWLDFLGTAMGLWYYTVKVIPTTPAYLIWDFTFFPILAMFLIQFKPRLNPYVKALIFSGISTFIGEPLFEWLGFYVRNQWEHIYSFPILYIIYLIAHYFSRRNSFDQLGS